MSARRDFCLKSFTRKLYLSTVDKVGLVQSALKPLPKVFSWARGKFKQINSNRKSRLLYEDFRHLVFELKDCFNDMNSHSFSNLTKQFASLIKKVSHPEGPNGLGGKLDEANMQALLINAWYSRFAEELRIDKRRMKLNVLLQKTLTLNALLNSLEAHVIRKLQESMKHKDTFPEHVRNSYAKLRDSYNFFLVRYESFLKRAQSQVGVISQGYFEHLE